MFGSDESPNDPQKDKCDGKVSQPHMHPTRLIRDPVNKYGRRQQPMTYSDKRVPHSNFGSLHRTSPHLDSMSAPESYLWSFSIMTALSVLGSYFPSRRSPFSLVARTL